MHPLTRRHRSRLCAPGIAAAWLAACVPVADDPAASATDDPASASSTSAASATTTSSTAGDETSTGGDASTSDGSTTADAPSCGDGEVDEGEACDLGEDNDDNGACTYDCALAVCGDQLVHDGVEACDLPVNDGSYGGCLPDCSALAPHCGDAVLQEAHESCEHASHGNLCDPLCELRDCAGLSLRDPTEASCPPEAQVNAAISGATPVGEFSGTFAAQSWGYYGSYWIILVAETYQPQGLCEPQSYLLIAGDAPIPEAPGEVDAHVLVSIAGEVALATGTLAVLADDYKKIDASTECGGSTSLTISVEGGGWSLGGAAQTTCCRSSDNRWVS